MAEGRRIEQGVHKRQKRFTGYSTYDHLRILLSLATNKETPAAQSWYIFTQQLAIERLNGPKIDYEPSPQPLAAPIAERKGERVFITQAAILVPTPTSVVPKKTIFLFP